MITIIIIVMIITILVMIMITDNVNQIVCKSTIMLNVIYQKQ